MERLQILSAGAAQGVVSALVERFQADNLGACAASYGGVHAVWQRVQEASDLDIVILTGALMDELITLRQIDPGSRTDLGLVATCLAVRSGEPLPAITSAEQLRAAFLTSTRVVCPDPELATAGKVLLRVLEQLCISRPMQARLEYCDSGAQTLQMLAAGTGRHELGVAQRTEILGCQTVSLVGSLPGAMHSTVMYSAGVAVQSRRPHLAKIFLKLLTAQPAALLAAGFE